MSFVGDPFRHDIFVSYSHGDVTGSGDSKLKRWSGAFARELESELRAEFPKAAAIRRDEGRLGSAMATILAYLEGVLPHIDLPLDIRATAFQRAVWEELRRIPYGETRSYVQRVTENMQVYRERLADTDLHIVADLRRGRLDQPVR